jgi:hypothetical protein
MATKRELLRASNIEIVSDPSTWLVGKAKKTTVADIYAKGDAMIAETTNGLCSIWVPSSSNNSSFAGILTHDSIGEEQVNSEDLIILLRGIVRIKTSAAVKFGESLLISAGPTAANRNAGTMVDWTVSSNAAAGTFWALENIASGAYGLAYFDVFAQPGVGSIFVTQT